MGLIEGKKVSHIIIVFLSFFILSSTTAQAQSCGCTVTIPATSTDLDATKLGIKPGAVVCLQAGTKRFLKLSNFVGTATAPITIKNCGGQVIIHSTDLTQGIKVVNSKFFRLTGSGDASFQYGIKVTSSGASAHGVNLDNFTTEFEVDHLEVANSGYAGIISKTSPKCDGTATRGAFTQNNIIFHDNYIHDVKLEGIYIGSSFFTGESVSCNGVMVKILPHEIKGLKIYNNVIKNTGWDGIQVGAATASVEVYGNTIENYGTVKKADQNRGIQINMGATGKYYNNMIKGGSGTGIFVLGMADIILYNNQIVNSGEHGIFCDDRYTTAGTSFHFVNNTIVNTVKNGISMYSDESKNNRIQNNIIINPGTYTQFETDNTSRTGKDAFIYLLNGAVSVINSNNITSPNASTLLFANASTFNYGLLAGSPAINAGTDLSFLGINKDITGNARPAGGAFDAGALESGGVSLPPSSSGLVINSTITQITCFGAANGKINLIVSGGNSPYTYAWSNTRNTASIDGLAPGNYTVTVTDQLGVKLSKTFTVTQPTALALSATTVAQSAGLSNGSINLSVSGGTPAYKYAWSNRATSEDLTGLIAGNYTATITDLNQCAASKTFSVASSTVTTTSTAIQINNLTLVNAASNVDISTFTNGMQLNYATLGTKQLSVRANGSSTVKSVVFTLDGNFIRTESALPHTIAGDNGSDYYPWTPTLGTHTLVLTPYGSAGASGTKGSVYTITFTVVDAATTSSMMANMETEPVAQLNTGFIASPNPIEDIITISKQPGIQGELSLTLLDATGVVLQTESSNFAIATTSFQFIPKSGLLAGTYYLNIVTSSGSETIRLMKN